MRWSGYGPPPWVTLEHDGLSTQLRQPWWVPLLVLWVVPLLVAAGGGIWWSYPAVIALTPEAAGRVTIAYGLVSALCLGVATAVALAVVWWTAPVSLRLRGDYLVVTRRFLGRSVMRRFDMRYTTVYGADDRSFVHLVMDSHDVAPPTEDVIALPLHQRHSWLARALRSAAKAARSRRGREPTEADEAAMARLFNELSGPAATPTGPDAPP